MEFAKLKVNELKRDTNKNVSNFISTYLEKSYIFEQICKEPKHFFDIFRAMIRHGNVQVISYIIETNKCTIDYLTGFNNKFPGLIGFYELIKPTINDDNYYDNNKINQLMWKFYDYSLPSCIFDPEHKEFKIIKNYIHNVMKLDDITQKKLLIKLIGNIVSHNKPSYMEIIINDFKLETFITENISDFILNALEYPNMFFNLIDITKYDFTDYKLSMSIMFFFIEKINLFSKFLAAEKKKAEKYLIYKDRIIQTIEKILDVHKLNFIQEIPDDTILYDSMSKYDVSFEPSVDSTPNVSTTFIMMRILSTLNKELFELGMKNKFMEINIHKWYRNIIIYTNLENYIIYSEFYPIFPIENMSSILDIIWENKYNLSDSKDSKYMYMHRCYTFFYYFIENYNSDTFVIKPDNYKYIADFILSKHRYETYKSDNDDKILSMKEYYEIIKFRPEMDNDDFMFTYAKRNSYNYVFSESRGWDEKMIDKFYQRYLEENIGFNTCIENIDIILQRHSNPNEYTNIEKIIIEVLTYGTFEIVKKITKFFTSHIDISQQEHMIFKKVFEVGERLFNLDDFDNRLDYIIQWLNSHVEPDYYQVFINKNNVILGHRCGNVISGMSKQY